jgi:hypothetical protein
MANNQGTPSKLSPAQRNMLFAQATRQHWQDLAPVNFVDGETVSFELPKVRLTSKVMLLVEGTVTVTHSSQTSFTPAAFAPYNLFKQVRVGVNNGFNPYQVSGIGLYLYNRTRLNADAFDRVSSGRNLAVLGTAASAGGSANPIKFLVELPFTINDRDPVGLILTQNPQTVVTVSIDFNSLTALLSSATGYTVTGNITITPIVESYTVPVIADALPDISVIKLVSEQNQAIPGPGDVVVKLPVGYTYRKIIAYITNSSGGVADSDLGEFQLKFNQADIPYRVKPGMLQAINQLYYGKALENGVYVFDFSYQGLPNYGGARDYVDTERLTEFWLQTTAAAAGNIMLVTETLARLQG